MSTWTPVGGPASGMRVRRAASFWLDEPPSDGSAPGRGAGSFDNPPPSHPPRAGGGTVAMLRDGGPSWSGNAKAAATEGKRGSHLTTAAAAAGPTQTAATVWGWGVPSGKSWGAACFGGGMLRFEWNGSEEGRPRSPFARVRPHRASPIKVPPPPKGSIMANGF